ncbi:Hypp3514 [Branchiostoma lanceolatum]|uniref:Hypp3514 protein n=1 Tax=Branchiostoma lanceolatum TaxID=7740 RepID=A0A8K0ES56_BRALA|nr:Hypp3514 [Branchiostoma lanceolatum]
MSGPSLTYRQTGITGNTWCVYGLEQGHPTVVTARMKVTYKSVIKRLAAQVIMKEGDVRGWEKVLLDKEMDQEHQGSSLCIDVALQFF